MTKKRFVEFYLKAMLQAAIKGRVTHLACTYTMHGSIELVRVELHFTSGRAACEFPVTDLSLLDTAVTTIGHVREAVMCL